MTELPPGPATPQVRPQFESLTAFEVVGVPAPQGSHSAVMRNRRPTVIVGSSHTGRAKHAAWRQTVAWSARNVAEAEPFDGALAVAITFRMPMPASRPKYMRDAPEWPCTVRPDIDKVLRATLDGLTEGGLIADDARVWKVDVEQVEVTGWTGAEILLRRWIEP